MVTRAIDGDTVETLLGDGRPITVRLIGIDTPERGEYGTDDATVYMGQLALGRTVHLVNDPSQDAVDRAAVPCSMSIPTMDSTSARR
jgi:endonuclease YncB( thermonuclease family)